jgi:hypothetical protein
MVLVCRVLRGSCGVVQMNTLELYQGQFNSIVHAFVFRRLCAVYNWLGRRIDMMMYGLEVE